MNSFRRFFRIAPVLLLAAGLSAQFRGPTGGVVYHQPSRSIRPVLGIPGSAHLGSAIVENVDFAAISPDGRWALAVRGESQTAVSGLDRMEPLERAIEGLIPGIDMAAWNEAGTELAVYSSATKAAQRVEISGTSLTAHQPVDLSALGGKISALAMGHPRRSIVFLVEGSDAPGLYRINDGGGPVLLAGFTRANGIAVSPDRDLIAVIDRDTREIRLFTDGVPSGSIPLQVEGEDWSYASCLAFSENAAEIYVAAGQEPALYSYNLSGELVSRQPLEAPADSMTALPLIKSYLLNRGAASGEPLVVYQRGSRSGVYFIPAGEISPVSQ